MGVRQSRALEAPSEMACASARLQAVSFFYLIFDGVITTENGGGYRWMNGTSAPAPHKDDYHGHGRGNARRAVELLLGGGPRAADGRTDALTLADFVTSLQSYGIARASFWSRPRPSDGARRPGPRA